MSTTNSPDKLSRAELVERVEALEQKVDELESNTVNRTTLNVLLSELGDIDDYTADPAQQRSLLAELVESLDSIEQRLESIEGDVEAIRDLGSEKTSKEEKVAQIVEYASNKGSVDQNRVTVRPKNIKGVTGVSRRYAYDLVDDMIGQYDWAKDPDEVKETHVEQDQRKRGVLIDFEVLHSTPEAVNKFTTEINDKGDSA